MSLNDCKNFFIFSVMVSRRLMSLLPPRACLMPSPNLTKTSRNFSSGLTLPIVFNKSPNLSPIFLMTSDSFGAPSPLTNVSIILDTFLRVSPTPVRVSLSAISVGSMSLNIDPKASQAPITTSPIKFATELKTLKIPSNSVCKLLITLLFGTKEAVKSSNRAARSPIQRTASPKNGPSIFASAAVKGEAMPRKVFMTFVILVIESAIIPNIVVSLLFIIFIIESNRSEKAEKSTLSLRVLIN